MISINLNNQEVYWNSQTQNRPNRNKYIIHSKKPCTKWTKLYSVLKIMEALIEAMENMKWKLLFDKKQILFIDFSGTDTE